MTRFLGDPPDSVSFLHLQVSSRVVWMQDRHRSAPFEDAECSRVYKYWNGKDGSVLDQRYEERRDRQDSEEMVAEDIHVPILLELRVRREVDELVEVSTCNCIVVSDLIQI